MNLKDNMNGEGKNLKGFRKLAETVMQSLFPPWKISQESSLRLIGLERVPILIVQGFMMKRESMYILDSELKKAGFAPISFDLRRLGIGMSIEELSKNLRRKIEHFFTKKLSNGYHINKRIPAIGFSMGGIILHYLTRVMDGAGFIDKVIGIASPVQGLNYAILTYPLKNIFPCTFDLWEGSSFIKNLRSAPYPPSCFFLSISSKKDFMAPPHSCNLPELPNTKNIVFKELFHSHLPFSPQISREVIDFLTSYGDFEQKYF